MNSNKNKNMRGAPASQKDQGQHSRFPARVLQRPGSNVVLFTRHDGSKRHLSTMFYNPASHPRFML